MLMLSVRSIAGKPQNRTLVFVSSFQCSTCSLQAPQKYLDRFPDIKDEKRKMFAAMLSAMDDAVGRVLAKVRELKQKKTLSFLHCR